MISMDNTLEYWVEKYENNQAVNDQVYEQFGIHTQKIEYLYQHKNYIIKNNLGFGDIPFHYMWYLLSKYCSENFENNNFLEIGVFKGQVISLWRLISIMEKTETNIDAISPLVGNPIEKNKLTHFFKKHFNKKYILDTNAGNFYTNENYQIIIKELFERFNIPQNINFYKGYSTDENIISEIKQKKYSLIYIDGDHKYKTVFHDISTYAALISPKGILVMDDASFYLAGTKFWKGYQSVSDACEILPDLGFKNILNVGHNRVYLKL